MYWLKIDCAIRIWHVKAIVTSHFYWHWSYRLIGSFQASFTTIEWIIVPHCVSFGKNPFLHLSSLSTKETTLVGDIFYPSEFVWGLSIVYYYFTSLLSLIRSWLSIYFLSFSSVKERRVPIHHDHFYSILILAFSPLITVSKKVIGFWWDSRHTLSPIFSTTPEGFPCYYVSVLFKL